MTCSLLTDTQKDRQTNRQKSKDRGSPSGLSEFLTSAHHQGAVQYTISPNAENCRKARTVELVKRGQRHRFAQIGPTNAKDRNLSRFGKHM